MRRIIYYLAFLVTVSLCHCSCSSVHKIKTSELKKIDSSSETVIDSVHVKKYDTSVVTHEETHYQTKTVEVFDTVHTRKDSVITFLKTRIVYTDSIANKTESKTGIGSDSSVNKGSNKTDLKKNDDLKTVQKDKSGIGWGKIFLYGFGLLILAGLFLIGRWAYKKYL